MKFLAAIFLLAALGVVATLLIRDKSAPSEMPFEELLVFLPQEAVAIAKEHHGVTLDYSPASIEQVELILGNFTMNTNHEAPPKGSAASPWPSVSTSAK